MRRRESDDERICFLRSIELSSLIHLHSSAASSLAAAPSQRCSVALSCTPSSLLAHSRLSTCLCKQLLLRQTLKAVTNRLASPPLHYDRPLCFHQPVHTACSINTHVCASAAILLSSTFALSLTRSLAPSRLPPCQPIGASLHPYTHTYMHAYSS